MNKYEALKLYFGYNSFRSLQEPIIDHILGGKNSLVLMPTGGGKSLCFQVPAMILPGLTLVVSPLIALMQDQVQNLQANGIEAAYINSTLSYDQQLSIEAKCRNGVIKLLYVSPEKLLSGNYLDLICSLNISLIAIDEAHCVSSWGHDFRPEYTKLHVLHSRLPQVPVVALTATADRTTRADILKQLQIPDAEVFLGPFDRPNLSLTVMPGQNRSKQIVQFIEKRKNDPGIIYCLSRKSTEQVAASLEKAGFRAKHYHAGCDPDYRAKVQDSFQKDKIDIIVATVAFGMGIDKSNVRWVIHYNLPSNLEGYYQEIGRAGRDGLPSDTLLFYSYGDVIQRQKMIEDSDLPDYMKELYFAKLERMKQFAQAPICRRKVLLSYFNETLEQNCGNCDVCKNPPTTFNGTVAAQKILSVVARTQEKVAMTMLVDVLRGSHNKILLDKGYQHIKTYGAGADLRPAEWQEYIMQLINAGLVDIAYDDSHSLKLNTHSWQILKGEREVSLVHFTPYTEQAAKKPVYEKEKSATELRREALFDTLKALRRSIADARDIPAFVVFSDASLMDMCHKMPLNKSSFLEVQGVGETKYNQYGDIFINEIISFQRKQNGGKTAKGFTYIETLELYKEGKTTAQIAETRGLGESTIISHLIKLKEEGENIDFSKIISDGDIKTIKKIAAELEINPSDAMKPLFDALNGKFDYGRIRLALSVN
jgi:ATP-dependent DNA helicase RecQ